MLSEYAAEISEYLSSMMGRSIIITDTNGIIIGAPTKERIGELHRPSVPCVKSGKMSFDDAEAAKKQGVWYPGCTVPIFWDGRVIGTFAVAGEPELVLQFSMLIKDRIESMLREKISAKGKGSPQKRINDLVRDIVFFNPVSDDLSKLKARAAESGIDLERSREIIAISFPDFRKAELGKNPQKITYGDNSGSNESETDSSVMTGRIIMLLREIFQDPGTIISNVSNDRFVVIRPIDLNSYSLTEDESYEGGSAAVEILRKLDEYRLNAVIGVGRPARGFSDLPAAYSDAWKIVSLSQRIGLPPGVYYFDNLMLESLLLSVKDDFVFDCVGKKTDALVEDDSGDLRTTFKVYCESFFNKQKAAERLHLHRNTLAYRLQRIEERLGVPLNDFKSVLACYLILRAKELQAKQQSE